MIFILLVLLAASPPVFSASSCARSDATLLGSYCYKLFNTIVAWNTANAACNSDGGWLTTIASSSENENVYTVSGGAQVWIGLLKVDKNSGAWAWQGGPLKGQIAYKNHKTVSGMYTNWYPGTLSTRAQPDNFTGNETLGVMSYSRGRTPSATWDDCSSTGDCRSEYVCQYYILTSTPSPTRAPTPQVTSKPPATSTRFPTSSPTAISTATISAAPTNSTNSSIPIITISNENGKGSTTLSVNEILSSNGAVLYLFGSGAESFTISLTRTNSVELYIIHLKSTQLQQLLSGGTWQYENLKTCASSETPCTLSAATSAGNYVLVYNVDKVTSTTLGGSVVTNFQSSNPTPTPAPTSSSQTVTQIIDDADGDGFNVLLIHESLSANKEQFYQFGAGAEAFNIKITRTISVDLYIVHFTSVQLQQVGNGGSFEYQSFFDCKSTVSTCFLSDNTMSGNYVVVYNTDDASSTFLNGSVVTKFQTSKPSDNGSSVQIPSVVLWVTYVVYLALVTAVTVYLLIIHPDGKSLRNQGNVDASLWAWTKSTVILVISHIIAPLDFVSDIFFVVVVSKTSLFKPALVFVVFPVLINSTCILCGIFYFDAEKSKIDRKRLRDNLCWYFFLFLMSVTEPRLWILFPWKKADIEDSEGFPTSRMMWLSFLKVAAEDIPQIILQTLYFAISPLSYIALVAFIFSFTAVLYLIFKLIVAVGFGCGGHGAQLYAPCIQAQEEGKVDKPNDDTYDTGADDQAVIDCGDEEEEEEMKSDGDVINTRRD